jgi:hypothetical protein
MSVAHQRTIHFQDSSESVLSRFSSVTDRQSPITDHQFQIDHLVDEFICQASDWKTLTALTLGGIAYRWGKIGILNVGAIHESPLLAGPLSIAGGLATEVTAFEFTNRVLQSLRATGRSPLQNQSLATNHRSPNLWAWSGPGGWKEALLSDLVTFGSLKGAGYLSRESNLVTQHLFSSSAMVAGQNAASQLGITPKSEGSLADQWIHAEAMNLQLGAGVALVHGLAPGMVSLERGLEVRFNFIRNRWSSHFYRSVGFR